MKSLTQGNVKAAVDSVRTTKWRSFSTMLGIIIGVASVLLVVSIGQGVKNQINKQVDNLGRDLITIRPKQISVGPGALNTAGILRTVEASGSLSDSDASTVQGTSGVRLVEPLSIVTGTPSNNGKPSPGTVAIGADGNFLEAMNQSMSYGSFFWPSDGGQDVVVLGANVAKEMFNDNVPLGETLYFHGKDFVVRGILNHFDTTPLSTVTDFNNAIFIPQETANDLTDNKAPIYEILVRPTDPKKTDAVVKSLSQSLLSAHGGQADFEVMKQSANIATTNNILNLLTKLIGGVAVISLLVGGIGIMNVMLVTVTERMYEIGIRKAVGATNRQILNQFVTESAVLSLIGGIIGVVFVFFIDVLIGIFSGIKPVTEWWAALLAILVSLLMGIVFGAIPALKAARKNPIDALRHD